LRFSWKNVGRAGVTFEDQFEHPHFRGAQAGAGHGKFFEQFHDVLMAGIRHAASSLEGRLPMGASACTKFSFETILS
jgi:hypothetical protein